MQTNEINELNKWVQQEKGKSIVMQKEGNNYGCG